jgi:hypothetical protein
LACPSDRFRFKEGKLCSKLSAFNTDMVRWRAPRLSKGASDIAFRIRPHKPTHMHSRRVTIQSDLICSHFFGIGADECNLYIHVRISTNWGPA